MKSRKRSWKLHFGEIRKRQPLLATQFKVIRLNKGKWLKFHILYKWSDQIVNYSFWNSKVWETTTHCKILEGLLNRNKYNTGLNKEKGQSAGSWWPAATSSSTKHLFHLLYPWGCIMQSCPLPKSAGATLNAVREKKIFMNGRVVPAYLLINMGPHTTEFNIVDLKHKIYWY